MYKNAGENMVISTTLDGGFEYNVLDSICELLR